MLLQKYIREHVKKNNLQNFAKMLKDGGRGKLKCRFKYFVQFAHYIGEGVAGWYICTFVYLYIPVCNWTLKRYFVKLCICVIAEYLNFASCVSLLVQFSVDSISIESSKILPLFTHTQVIIVDKMCELMGVGVIIIWFLQIIIV